MKKIAVALAMVLVSGATMRAQKVEFWMGNGKASIDSFMAHKDKIDVISPTWYNFDENGLVVGEPQPVVLKAAPRCAHDDHSAVCAV